MRVDRNFELTSDSLVQVNGMPENVKITELSIKNSSGTVVDGTLDGYDVYSVSYEMNGKSVEQKFVPVPSTSLTLTNALTNASFESEITDSYNGTWYRSTSIKRTGSYSAYFTCSSSQAFLRIMYGDIGAKDNDVYVRVYSYTDNTTLSPGIYVYEKETVTLDWGSGTSRYVGWFKPNLDPYQQWLRKSTLTSPTTENYSYFFIQYSQSSTSGTGNVYWDDVMALVLDSGTWDVTPTVAWLDRMIPDFTDTQTISW